MRRVAPEMQAGDADALASCAAETTRAWGGRRQTEQQGEPGVTTPPVLAWMSLARALRRAGCAICVDGYGICGLVEAYAVLRSPRGTVYEWAAPARTVPHRFDADRASSSRVRTWRRAAGARARLKRVVGRAAGGVASRLVVSVLREWSCH